MNGTQWAGDYLASGIDAISMDVLNMGQTDLVLRLVFENPQGGAPTDLAVSTLGISLPAGSGWASVEFPITPADLTAVAGNVETALATTTLIRLMHSPAAAFPPDPIFAQLGVDNITAVPEPAGAVLLLAAAAGLMRRRRGAAGSVPYSPPTGTTSKP